MSQGKSVAKATASTLVCKLLVENGEKHFYFIGWTLNGQKYSNHYMTNSIDIDYKEYMSYIEKCGYIYWMRFYTVIVKVPYNLLRLILSDK